MPYTNERAKELFTELGVEVEGLGTGNPMFKLHAKSEEEANRILKEFSTNGSNDLVLIGKEKGNKYTLMAPKTELEALLKLVDMGKIKLHPPVVAQVAVVASAAPSASIVPISPAPSQALSAEEEKKLNSLYTKTFAALVESSETEASYRIGLETAAATLKSFKENKDPNLKFNRALLDAYEGAINKALQTSKAMYDEAEKIKKILPAALVTKLKRWQVVQQEMDQIKMQSRSAKTEAEKSRLEEAVKAKETERDLLASEIATAMKNDKELFNKLAEPIGKIGEHFKNYTVGLRDTRRFFDIVSHDEKQAALWVSESIKRSKKSVFDYLSTPQLRPTKVKFPLEGLKESLEKFSANEKEKQKMGNINAALDATLARIKVVSGEINEEQRVDDFSVIQKDKIRVIRTNDYIKELERSIESKKEAIKKIEKQNKKTPEKIPGLTEKLKSEQLKLQSDLKTIRELINLKGEKFRERTENALNAASAFEREYAYYTNAMPKTPEMTKKLDNLRKDFVTKASHLTEDERKYLDEISKIDQFKLHNVINKILTAAKTNADNFVDTLFHDYVRGKEYSKKTIEGWDRSERDKQIKKEEGKIVKQRESNKKLYAEIKAELNEKIAEFTQYRSSLTDKMRAGDKIEIMARIDEKRKELAIIIKEQSDRLSDIKAKMIGELDAITLPALSVEKEIAKRALDSSDESVRKIISTARIVDSDLERLKAKTFQELAAEVDGLRNQAVAIRDGAVELSKKSAVSLAKKSEGDYAVDHNKQVQELEHQSNRVQEILTKLQNSLVALQVAKPKVDRVNKQEEVGRISEELSLQKTTLEKSARALAEKIATIKVARIEEAKSELGKLVNELDAKVRAVKTAHDKIKAFVKEDRLKKLDYINEQGAKYIPDIKKYLKEKLERIEAISSNFSADDLEKLKESLNNVNAEPLKQSIEDLEKRGMDEKAQELRELTSAIGPLVKFNHDHGAKINRLLREVEKGLEADDKAILSHNKISHFRNDIKDLEKRQLELEKSKQAMGTMVERLHNKEASQSIKELTQIIKENEKRIKDVHARLDKLTQRQKEIFKKGLVGVEKLISSIDDQYKLITKGPSEKVNDYLKNTDIARYAKIMKEQLVKEKSKIEHAGDAIDKPNVEKICKSIDESIDKLKQLENLLERRKKLDVPVAEFVKKYKNAVYFEEYKQMKKQAVDPQLVQKIMKVFSKHIDISKDAQNEVTSLRALQKDLTNADLCKTPAGNFICGKIRADLDSVLAKVDIYANVPKPGKGYKHGSGR
jgi:hypothetical protein